MNVIIQLLILIIGILFLLEIAFFIVRIFVSKEKVEEDDDITKIRQSTANNNLNGEFGKFHGVLRRENLLEFLNFDKVEDGMIIRNNGEDYVMVLQCNGINFDLRSEDEKIAIEEGFLQFLNTLKFPVQLYVQTRSLNFSEVIGKYDERIIEFETEILKLEKEIKRAESLGDSQKIELLTFEKKRKENLYEYAKDSVEYTKHLNKNKSVLQQKTYVVVSYNKAEAGAKVGEDATEEDIKLKAFEELYTRCDALSGALSMSGVSSRVINSEELVELLFNSFNRDELENINLQEFLRKDYDSLYTKAEDIIEKKKREIHSGISKAAVELASSSIIKADKKRRMELLRLQENRGQKIKETANSLIDEKRSDLPEETYNIAKEMINNTSEEDYNESDSSKKRSASVRTQSEQDQINDFIEREFEG